MVTASKNTTITTNASLANALAGFTQRIDLVVQLPLILRVHKPDLRRQNKAKSCNNPKQANLNLNHVMQIRLT